MNPRMLAWPAVLALLLGVLGLFWPPLAAASLAVAFALAAPVIGGLLLQLAVPLVSGSWQGLILPGAGRIARLAPLLGLLLLPLLLAQHRLYAWALEGEEGFRGVWLSPLAFTLRTLLYVALWSALAWLLPRRPRLAGPGLVLLVLSGSAAAIDWAMSLEPEFFSTLYGLLYLSRGLLSAIALAVLLALHAGAERRGVLRGLLIAAVLLWLYLHYMQYLIIWSADLPREIRWYLTRIEGFGAAVVWLLGVGQGLLPLVLLLLPLGERSGALQGVAITTLLLGQLELLWWVLPAFAEHSPLLLWSLGALLTLAWLLVLRPTWPLIGGEHGRG